jgi:hypothetical protein
VVGGGGHPYISFEFSVYFPMLSPVPDFCVPSYANWDFTLCQKRGNFSFSLVVVCSKHHGILKTEKREMVITHSSNQKGKRKCKEWKKR